MGINIISIPSPVGTTTSPSPTQPPDPEQNLALPNGTTNTIQPSQQHLIAPTLPGGLGEPTLPCGLGESTLPGTSSGMPSPDSEQPFSTPNALPLAESKLELDDKPQKLELFRVMIINFTV